MGQITICELTLMELRWLLIVQKVDGFCGSWRFDTLKEALEYANKIWR